MEVRDIQISQIKVGEHEQRIDEDDPGLAELAASIDRIGILVPLILEKKGDSFHLVSGHRRILAATRVGLSTVPCIITDSSKSSPSEITFAENFFRKDLSPVELACALRDCYTNAIMTVAEMAVGFHKTEHWVHSMIAIADWPGEVLEAVHTKKLSVSAAANLVLIRDDTYREFLVRQAVENGATARATAAWLQAERSMLPPEAAVNAPPVPMGAPAAPLVPQAPCLCCSQLFMVNEMSHVPICGPCIQILRAVGASGGVKSLTPMQPE